MSQHVHAAQMTRLPLVGPTFKNQLLDQRPQDATRTLTLLAWLVVLGLALRCYHYFSDPPVWHDEAAQIYNVLNKDYGEMLGPLYYSEACPPLFLAAEKAVVGVIGDGTLALRLLPFLASCCAFVGLTLMAHRGLPPKAGLWFALLLACSDRLLWHSCEAKPYAVDVLVATVVLAIGLGLGDRSRRQDESNCQLLALTAALTPLLIFLSFPACFLLGGLALTLLPAVWRSRRPATWIAYLGFGVVLCGSFVLLYVTAIQAQKNERIISCWQDKFPPWDQPWLVPMMGVLRLTELFRYAAEPVGNVLTPVAVVGALFLWRTGQGVLLGLLVWPIALNGSGWLGSSYPLEASRVVAYAAPAALLLMANGIPPMLAWLGRCHRLASLALVALALVPACQTAWVLVTPWKRPDSKTPSAFVLQRRLTTEPVVGTLWEQAYYLREIGPAYRSLNVQPTEPPSLAPAAAVTAEGAVSEKCVDSLWLLASPDPAEQATQVEMLHPGGPWRVVERYDFRNVVVLRLGR